MKKTSEKKRNFGKGKIINEVGKFSPTGSKYTPPGSQFQQPRIKAANRSGILKISARVRSLLKIGKQTIQHKINSSDRINEYKTRKFLESNEGGLDGGFFSFGAKFLGNIFVYVAVGFTEVFLFERVCGLFSRRVFFSSAFWASFYFIY
jgi:ribosomal protein S16